jgi:hypothetical protein
MAPKTAGLMLEAEEPEACCALPLGGTTWALCVCPLKSTTMEAIALVRAVCALCDVVVAFTTMDPLLAITRGTSLVESPVTLRMVTCTARANATRSVLSASASKSITTSRSNGVVELAVVLPVTVVAAEGVDVAAAAPVVARVVRG